MDNSYTIPVREVRRVPPPVLLPERRRGAGIGYPQYDLYTAAVNWIERAIAGRNWAGKVTVVLVLLSLFLHFPSYNYLAGHLNGTESNARWTALVEQSAEPFVGSVRELTRAVERGLVALRRFGGLDPARGLLEALASVQPQPSATAANCWRPSPRASSRSARSEPPTP